MKSAMASEEAKALETLKILNPIINLSAERLDGLRTQCATNAEITHQEIRTLEGKLIKLFSDQLIAKKRISPQNLPQEYQNRSLRLWLQIVGLTSELTQGICTRVTSLESLKERSDHDIRILMSENHANEEETRRLTLAPQNLKRYTDLRRCQIDNEKESSQSSISFTNEFNDLYWDSWDMNKVTIESLLSSSASSPHVSRNRAARSSVPSEEYLRDGVQGGPSSHSCSTTPCTPVTTMAPSSLNSPAFSPGSHPNIYSPTNSSVFTMGYSLEQLPRRRLPTEPGGSVSTWDSTMSQQHSSHNSKSGASSSNAPYSSGNVATTSSSITASISSASGSSMGGYHSPLVASPIKSPPVSHGHGDLSEDLDPHKNSLQVPKSPRTPNLARSMGHMISHRFTKMFKVSTCDYCYKQVIIGLRCKECKFKCHRDCEPRVPPSCGLPTEFIDVFVQHLKKDGENPVPRFSTTSPNPNWGRSRKITRAPGNMHIQPFSGPDSSSNTSSCNSSTPSSPYFATTGSTSSCSTNHLFHFPDVERDVTLETRSLSSVANHELSSTEKSNDSDRTISQTSGSGSTDSEKTLALRVDSQDSQVSDGEPADRTWPRQNSLSNREWDIPFDELKIGDKIGTGHFGTVYRGNWHGDVAIKVLDMAYVDNEKTLEQFKQEVAIFRKTRHENLVLFMGACMKPPRLAIVTSMCKGMSLHTHLHLRKDKFNMNRTAAVAAQITQGMGYLHARGIIHKDLKSKNIFIETGNGKIVITDFGLFSVTKLCQGNREGDSLSIPPGWLCYLAPEIMKSLRPMSKHDSELPFTKASDIYAFGTVWFELLTGEWPYKGLPPEAVIWQVGSGIRQPLPTLFSRDVKEILMSCWSGKPEERVDFTRIQKIVEKLPKKRLARSPSHPIHLSRSAESVF